MDFQKLDHVSYSSIGTILGCSEKADLRYIRRVQPDEAVPDYLYVGRMVDRALEYAARDELESYDGILKLEKIDFADQKWFHWCRGIWDGRKDLYECVYQGAPVVLQRIVHFDIIDKETGEILVNNKGDILRALGFVDGYNQEANRIHEVKTGDPKSIEEYAFEGQTQLYCLGIMDELGVDVPEVEYDFIKKPQIKQKKTETEEEFYERIYQHGLTVEVTHIPIQYERESLIETAKYLIEAVQNSIGTMPIKNRHECFKFSRKCEYFNQCWRFPFVMPEIKETREEV